MRCDKNTKHCHAMNFFDRKIIYWVYHGINLNFTGEPQSACYSPYGYNATWQTLEMLTYWYAISYSYTLYFYTLTIQYLTAFFRTEPWSHNIELFDCLSNLLQSRKPTTTCKLLQKHRKPEIITRNMPKLGTKSHFLGHPLLGWDFW